MTNEARLEQIRKLFADITKSLEDYYKGWDSLMTANCKLAEENKKLKIELGICPYGDNKPN